MPGSNCLNRPLALIAAVAFAAAAGLSEPTGKTKDKPPTNLDYWLGQAKAARGDEVTHTSPVNPFGRADRFRRADALPGVVVFSDGRIVSGGLYTTRDKKWQVWVEAEKRWRHIPPIVVLSIEAIAIEEGMEKEWRWKEMGSDEKIYTGREKPIRRFLWKFHLIDDSYVTGAVKGQPLWIESAGKRTGPFILHERSAGKYGQRLPQLVYLKRAIISRRAMEQVRTQQPSSGPASGPKPAGGHR